MLSSWTLLLRPGRLLLVTPSPLSALISRWDAWHGVIVSVISSSLIDLLGSTERVSFSPPVRKPRPGRLSNALGTIYYKMSPTERHSLSPVASTEKSHLSKDKNRKAALTGV